jgi:hypothetical protein
VFFVLSKHPVRAQGTKNTTLNSDFVVFCAASSHKKNHTPPKRIFMDWKIPLADLDYGPEGEEAVQVVAAALLHAVQRQVAGAWA